MEEFGLNQEGKEVGAVKRRRWVWVAAALVVFAAVGSYLWWTTQKAAFEALPKAAQEEGVSREVRDLMDEWSKPEEGRLAGRVVGLDDFGIVVEDFNGKHWYALSEPGQTPGRELYAVFMNKVRVKGTFAGGMNFKAEEFLPWVDPPSEN